MSRYERKATEMVRKIKVQGKPTISFSQFSEYFKYQERKKWAENDVVLRFIFFMIADRENAYAGVTVFTDFCLEYCKAESKDTLDDILTICYNLWRITKPDPEPGEEEKYSDNNDENKEPKIYPITGKRLIKRKERLDMGNTRFNFENDSYVKLLKKIQNNVPETFANADEFVQFITKQLNSDKSGKTYNPDVIEMFRAIDVDGSWKITYDEFYWFYKRNNKILENNDEIIRLMFFIIDSDGSNEIELDEFSVFAKAYQCHDINTEAGLLKCIFYMIDSDHSGTLDYKEVKSVMTRFYKTTDEDFNKFMKKIDKNNDGDISFLEFLRIFNVQYI